MPTVYLNDEELGTLNLALYIAKESEEALMWSYGFNPSTTTKKEAEACEDKENREVVSKTIQNITNFKKLRKKLWGKR
jgi:hypothetical protein